MLSTLIWCYKPKSPPTRKARFPFLLALPVILKFASADALFIWNSKQHLAKTTDKEQPISLADGFRLSQTYDGHKLALFGCRAHQQMNAVSLLIL